MKAGIRTAMAGMATMALLLGLPAAAQQAAPTQAKIGYVNTERLMREAAPAARAQKKLEAEFKKRDEELARMAEQLRRLQEDLEKNAMTMSETQRRTKEREWADLNRELQRRQREFREDRNQRVNEEMAQLVEQTQRVIRQIGEQEKYDIIIQDSVYFNPRIDITEKVLKALESAKPPAK